jgi:hypothetical protein
MGQECFYIFQCIYKLAGKVQATKRRKRDAAKEKCPSNSNATRQSRYLPAGSESYPIIILLSQPSSKLNQTIFERVPAV